MSYRISHSVIDWPSHNFSVESVTGLCWLILVELSLALALASPLAGLIDRDEDHVLSAITRRVKDLFGRITPRPSKYASHSVIDLAMTGSIHRFKSGSTLSAPKKLSDDDLIVPVLLLAI
jgi:hypothetical protein